MKLNKLHWLSAVCVFALVSGLLIHLFLSSDDKPAHQPYTVKNNLSEFDQVSVAKEQQITALTIKLAELQSQVLRLNALGDRLADEAEISSKEFNFEQLPPSGGPMVQSQASNKRTLAELLLEMNSLEQELAFEEKQLKMLESVNFGHHIRNDSYLSGKPIVKGWLSSYFGMRKDPFHGRPTMHKGVDFAGKEDAAIIATAAGVVSWASDRYGYGQLIEIDHGNGLKTRYGHNKKIMVAVGDVVDKGQVIAKMGSTGRSTGPHVHYEILKNNKQINPIKYVYRKAK